MEEKKALLEAALFVSSKPLSLERLAQLVELEPTEVLHLLAELKQELEAAHRGIELAEGPEGYELRVKPRFRQAIVAFAPLAELSDGALRTLALVVLKQPFKQSELVKAQGNKAYGYVKLLVEKGLIRAQPYGRTKLLSTTSQLESYFGMEAEELKRQLEARLKPEQSKWE